MFHDVHVCDFCKKRPSTGDTHTDYNGCEYASNIIDSVENHDSGFNFFGSGNDRKVVKRGKVVLETKDNGGGYDIIRCGNLDLDYNLYIKSEQWKEKREDRKFLDGLKCRFCGSAKNLQVHHITYENVPNEDMDDLITLCKSCHEKLHLVDIQRKKSFFSLADYQK